MYYYKYIAHTMTLYCPQYWYIIAAATAVVVERRIAARICSNDAYRPSTVRHYSRSTPHSLKNPFSLSSSRVCALAFPAVFLLHDHTWRISARSCDLVSSSHLPPQSPVGGL